MAALAFPLDAVAVAPAAADARSVPKGSVGATSRRRDDRALFGYSVGPQSWKPYFFVPTLRLWRARRSDGSFVVLEKTRSAPLLALIGARSCNLHAIGIQDKVFLEGPAVDQEYRARRSGTFVVAITVGRPAGPAFAHRFERGRGRPSDSTWRSPSSSTTKVTASSSRSGANRAPRSSSGSGTKRLLAATSRRRTPSSPEPPPKWGGP